MSKAFFIVLLLASGLRFTALTFDSLWLDESYQTVVESYGNSLPDLFNPTGKAFLYKSQKPAAVKDLLNNFRKVDPLCPPLFAVLMNYWITIFGGSDISLRGFSSLCSMLAISATYFFGSILLGKNAGLYAALLQAISPFDISYAQEARMYSLCTFLAILSGGSLLYLCLKKKSSKHILFAAIYIISTWGLINTHYTQIFVWAFAVFLLVLRSQFSAKIGCFLSIFIIANLCILALSLPWAALFLQAAAIRTASFYVMRKANLWWPIWALFVRIPFNWLTFLSGKKVMFWAIPIYLTSLILIGNSLLALINHIKKISTKKINKSTAVALILNYPLTLIFLWSTLPALMIWTLDVLESHRVIEISRYIIGTAPAIFLLAGYSLSLLKSKSYFMPLVICHTILCLANNAYLHLVPQKENWRQIAHLIEQNCSPNDLLFVSNYYNIVCLDRYLEKPLRQIGISSTTGASIIQNSLKEEKTDLNLSPNFWVLSAQEG